MATESIYKDMLADMSLHKQTQIGYQYCSGFMIAIVKCRHHQPPLEIPSVSDLKKKSVRKLFGVFVIPCSAMNVSLACCGVNS